MRPSGTVRMTSLAEDAAPQSSSRLDLVRIQVRRVVHAEGPGKYDSLNMYAIEDSLHQWTYRVSSRRVVVYGWGGHK